MPVWGIVLLCLGVLYYIIGWCTAIITNKLWLEDKIELYTDDGDSGLIIAAVFGLGIIPIIIYIRYAIKEKRNKAMKVIAVTLSYKDSTVYGMHIDEHQYLCFGFPDNLYYGYIPKDVRKMNKAELDKAMDMISDWGFGERDKIAKINAITEIYKQKE